MSDSALPKSIPYVMPYGAVPEIVTPVVPDDERLWVPVGGMTNVWSRPLFFNTVNGGWIDLLRVRRSGFLSRHRHPGPVHGYVIKGSWRYLEHDWVARAGMYVFEPPGEVHTLVVDDVPEMLTLFNISGSIIFVDENGQSTGFEDVFIKIEQARKHYADVGLGADFVDQFIR